MAGKNKLKRVLSWVLICLGLVGLAGGGLLITRQASPSRPKAVDVAAAPSSVKPSAKAVATYNVPPTLPKYITIPSINVPQTRVIRLGTLANGQIATPNNIYDAGWYDGSRKPGQNGAMFIYGHVSSWTAKGVFYNLKKLQAGNIVTVSNGANAVYSYKVVSIKIYPYNNVNMQQVLAPIEPGKPGLNLMTCTGSVIKGTSEFNQRLVVFSSLVKS